MRTYYTYLDSPIDRLLLASDGDAITGITMAVHRHGPTIGPEWTPHDDDALFKEAKRQLCAYFQGELQEFDLPLRLTGTPFQQQVWAELRRIPYGATVSYGELARRIGNPAASRAVGLANGRNPISIVVACHRVIGASGRLTGYGGGLDRKQWLLEHEGGSQMRAERGAHLPRPPR